MKTFIVKRRFLGLFSFSHEVDRPHIRKVRASVKTGISNTLWLCEGAGYMGCGESPTQAWNDWANRALI